MLWMKFKNYLNKVFKPVLLLEVGGDCHLERYEIHLFGRPCHAKQTFSCHFH